MNVLRIGELSRRSGVAPELLRAWERRYGLLQPDRSNGGLRLYSLDDLERVRRMRRHLAAGLAAAEAAALAREADDGDPDGVPASGPEAARRELAAALERFDEPAAQAVLDRQQGATTLDALLRDLVLPLLHELGERWQRGEASVAQEHFASALLRGRLLGLARGWGGGLGPLALLACPPGEEHDLGLLAFGLALHGRGWRVAYLGSDTPPDTLTDAARTLMPALVALSTVCPERLEAVAAPLRELARRQPLALGGSGADEALVAALGARVLEGDPVSAAEQVTALFAAGDIDAPGRGG